MGHWASAATTQAEKISALDATGIISDSRVSGESGNANAQVSRRQCRALTSALNRQLAITALIHHDDTRSRAD